jgi:hypothetical protein
VKRFAAILLVAAAVVLHQDAWLWTDKRLVLGFLPVGMAYHVAYTVAAAGLMGLLVRWAGPPELKDAPEP